jgi:hypothetical protein
MSAQPNRPMGPTRISLPPGTPSSTTSHPDASSWVRSPQVGGNQPPSNLGHNQYPPPTASRSALPPQQRRYANNNGGYSSATPRMAGASSASMRGPGPGRQAPGSAMPSAVGNGHSRSWSTAAQMSRQPPQNQTERAFYTPQLGGGASTGGMSGRAPAGGNGGNFQSYAFNPASATPRQQTSYSATPGTRRGRGGSAAGASAGPGPMRNQQYRASGGGSAMPGGTSFYGR